MPGSSSRLSFVLLFGVLLLASSCTRLTQPEVKIGNEPDPLLPFGNPSDASNAYPNNYLLRKSTFVLSYNNSRGSANWVAWRTTIADLGDSITRPDFEPDPTLPIGFDRVTPSDYISSGFDRGHMVPSADRFGNPAANAETFLMTNIVPQSHALNQYPWEKLERYARGIVHRGEDVYTIAGVYGEKARLRGRVSAPTNCWKIIIVLAHGAGIESVGDSTRVIAVDMPNNENIGHNRWQDFLTSVRSIEQKTGYNFLSVLPQDMQDILENRVDRSSSEPPSR
jgi:endonuclease G